ncbi:MAG TPA: ComF family protein [Patescibacteria group bacterium]|nr:ComF family protein [Patescibacteria group bacterium]
MGVLDLLFPAKCLSCQKTGNYLCEACQSLIPWHTEAKCLSCGKRAIGGYTHPGCLGKLGLDRTILLAHHRGPIRSLIQGLKYKRLTSEADFLTDLIVSRLNEPEFKGFVVTSVPLHYSRHLGRGFNQSDLLGRGLSGRLNILYKDDILYRPSKTFSQVDLDKSERASNVRGAFKLADESSVRGAKILLVDDVITTGSTVKECAKVLKRSGAKEVWALALAHG